jgi:beta-glucosidase
MVKSAVKVLCVVFLTCVSANLVVHGQSSGTPVYKDSSQAVPDRVNDLMSQMTLDEKIGQMTLVEKGGIKTPDIAGMGIGALLSGGGGYPTPNTAEAWAAMVNGFQRDALGSRLGIPILYGVDAVHGHNNLYGTAIFPQPIALGAANDPDLVQRIGHATAQVMIATGIYWDYAPVVAVAQDIRWGRTYESYSENTALVSSLSSALIRGLQGTNLNDPTSVLATPKHFVGDGGTAWGSSTSSNYKIDQGVTEVDEATLRAIHLPPYIEAIKNGAQSIMVSFSSWGGIKMSGQKHLVTDVLKGELGFTGFTVSDWQAIDQLPGSYQQQVTTSINAGLDMIMVPDDYVRFITALKAAVTSGDVPTARIDDAVRRILTVKFKLGLFERPFSDPSLLSVVGSPEQRALAREAVNKSLVLLQNNNGALPLAKDTPLIYVGGASADDIGIQSGGWTLEWQGETANSVPGWRGKVGTVDPGTSILKAIHNAVSPNTIVEYSAAGQFDAMADVGIAVVGELPYAEGVGDAADLALSSRDAQLVDNLRKHSKKLIVILLSGRPMIIGPQLNESDAFVAAWLPGTEGEGVADDLFGDKPFTGKLSFTWPRTMKQLPFDFKNLPTTGCDAPLFPFGYGLDTSSKATVNDQCAVASAASTSTPAAVAVAPIPSKPPIAPPEITGQAVYIPFPVNITIDGKLDDWAGVPLTTVDRGPYVSKDPAEDGSFSFGLAADTSNLYVLMLMVDKNIVTGQHGTDYWNEDSMEFYVNQSGNLSATAYGDGIYQININPGDIGKTNPGALTITGVNSKGVKVQGIVFKTANGWGFEASVPLAKPPTHGSVIGFQAHANGASVMDRDTKLIWSLADTSDLSYQNPSLFGQGIFFQIGRTDIPKPSNP